MKVICVSDLHGNDVKYRKLCACIKLNLPDAVFIAGDVLPNYYVDEPDEFIRDTLYPQFNGLKNELEEKYPRVFLINGNDDAAASVEFFRVLESDGLLNLINNSVVNFNGFTAAGYPYVPPTPFLLKDWEKYDISRYVPRGCVSPEEGLRTVEVAPNITKYSTIKDDLNEMALQISDFGKTIMLFHAPPCDTNLDKIAGKDINGSSEIRSIGSIAIRKFIEKFQPLVTLHGHLHESTDITGEWSDKIGDTYCFNAAHSGNELAVIEFNTIEPAKAERVLF